MNSKPIVPWIGGKRRLAKILIPQFPEHTCYCEPFAGAAALFFLKDPSKAEVINDVNGDLINLYRVVQHHLEEFCRQFKWALVSRQIYHWAKLTPGEIQTDIQRAAHFYYLQRLSFGGKVKGRVFGTSASAPPKLNLLRIEEDLSVAHLRLSRVTIEHLDWQACIAKYDRGDTFFTSIRHTGKQRATASIFLSSSTKSWPSACDRSGARCYSASTIIRTSGRHLMGLLCRMLKSIIRWVALGRGQGERS